MAERVRDGQGRLAASRRQEGALWECSTCRQMLHVARFTWDRRRQQPYRVCKDCSAVAERARRRTYTVRQRRAARVHRLGADYGLTPEQYEALGAAQGWRCAICGDPVVNILEHDGDGRLASHVDHCHTSSRVRGILCHGCNTGLGGFRDDPTRLRAAVLYLGT